MDQVTASIQMTVEGNFRLLTTEYVSECGCQWVVDMWGNVRRVRICPRDTDDIRWQDQLSLGLDEPTRTHDLWKPDGMRWGGKAWVPS